MTDRELMQQALDALELLAWYENPATKVQVRKPRNGGPIVTMYPHKVATEAAAPLRERLAQQEQEPVFDCPRCGHCCPQSNILAAWMIQRGYATGHGDTVEDLLKELEWQIAENWTNALVKGVEGEREACAKVCEHQPHWRACAAAIRARGNT